MRKFWLVIIILIVLGCGVILYARFIGTKGLNVKEYKIVDSKITADYHGLKIVHLSDIHYGSTIKNNELKKIVQEINLLKPDVVVLTGDLIDEDWEFDENELIENLKSIKASLGKYAITGNHDVDNDVWTRIITESEFKNMNDNYELIYKGNEPIILSGISSNIITSFSSEKTEKFDDYIKTLKENNKDRYYSILLIHEPDFIDNLDLNNYDLVLSGHSHNGQVKFPIIGKIYTPDGAKKYYNEYYKVNDTELYISSGLGTAWLRLRLFNRPSFNFYRLTNK